MGCCYRPRDVAWSVCLSVCLLVTTVSPAKTVEPIDLPFGSEDSSWPKKPLHEEHTGNTWRIRESDVCSGDDVGGPSLPYCSTWSLWPTGWRRHPGSFWRVLKIINSELGRFMSLFVVFVQWTYFSGLLVYVRGWPCVRLSQIISNQK